MSTLLINESARCYNSISTTLESLTCRSLGLSRKYYEEMTKLANNNKINLDDNEDKYYVEKMDEAINSLNSIDRDDLANDNNQNNIEFLMPLYKDINDNLVNSMYGIIKSDINNDEVVYESALCHSLVKADLETMIYKIFELCRDLFEEVEKLYKNGTIDLTEDELKFYQLKREEARKSLKSDDMYLNHNVVDYFMQLYNDLNNNLVYSMYNNLISKEAIKGKKTM